MLFPGNSCARVLLDEIVLGRATHSVGYLAAWVLPIITSFPAKVAHRPRTTMPSVVAATENTLS